MNPLHAAIDIVFPSRCVSCGLPSQFSEYSLCAACREKISLKGDSCPVCSSVIDGPSCRVCRGRAFYLTKNFCLADYSGPMKDAVRAMKFSGKKLLYKPLADMCAEEIIRREVNTDYVTFVPMSPAKKFKRGFNQAELIAGRLSKKIRIPLIKTMTESRSAESQRDQSYEYRFLNAIGRYKVINKPYLSGKTILLIDDVFTTGATINECARILLESGVKSIFSLTLARTGIKRLEFF